VKRRILRLSVTSLAVFGLFSPVFGQSPAQSTESDDALRAGIVKIDITPDKPVRMSGYSGRKELSTGVHDPLYARIVAFESGTRRLVFVSTDLIGFYETYGPICDAICARFHLKPSEVFLSSTHTHSGPTPTLSVDAHPNNLEYTQSLQAKLLEAIGQALRSIGPVQIGTGRGYSPVGSNRRERQPDGSVRLGRNPYGPTDKEVLVMKLAKPDGTPMAALFDYATHATSLGPRNLEISSDVLGIAAQFVEKVLGPDVTAPVFAGASGDIDPWYRVLPSFDTANGWIPEPELLGILLGEEVVHVFRNVKTTSSSAEIKTGLATLELAARKKEDRDEDASPTRQLTVTVARVGDVAFVGVGCELLTEVGMAIKAGSPYEHTFVITHCNGGAGYLPPKHLYKEGGYEIDRTGFAPEAAEMLVSESLRMLSGLSADEPLALENGTPFGANRLDEPFRDEFSIDAAVRFLDAAALNWQKERKCFACHSDYAFFFTRPLVDWKVPAHEELRSKLEYLAENPRDVKYRVTEAVMVASMLAQNDALTTGKLHPATRKALDRMWTMQREDGGFDWMKYNQPPSEIDDHYGVTVAAIGAGVAPDDYADTPAAKVGLDKIRAYFHDNPPANLHHRAMKLLASLQVDGIVAEAERKQVIEDLFALQKSDGGWGVVTMGNWERSDDKPQDMESSDGYGTGFAIYILRRAGVPAEDPRIQKGIAWLKDHQRASGRWFTRSMWKDSKHYIAHAGTAYAILALATCGEVGPNKDTPLPR